MDEIPVVSRSQRRSERRQMAMMVVLMLAFSVASFFLGVMVGERGTMSAADLGGSLPRHTVAQVDPPPRPTSAAVPSRLTFYDDLPKGNSAPLGSGINLPKSVSVPPPAPAAASPAPAPTAMPEPAPAPAPLAAAATAAAPAPAPPAPVATAAAPAIKPVADTPAPATVPKAGNGGSTVVQVASTKDQAEAKRLVEKLKGAGYAAYSEKADLGAKGVWYRVVAGPYADRAAADKAAAQLKKQKYSVMVRTR